MIQPVYNDELYHHGIKGMKWGTRRNSISSTIKTIHDRNSSIKRARRSVNSLEKKFNTADNAAAKYNYKNSELNRARDKYQKQLDKAIALADKETTGEKAKRAAIGITATTALLVGLSKIK